MTGRVLRLDFLEIEERQVVDDRASSPSINPSAFLRRVVQASSLTHNRLLLILISRDLSTILALELLLESANAGPWETSQPTSKAIQTIFVLCVKLGDGLFVEYCMFDSALD